MFALVDGNNFYASCEQVFQPELRGKPLIVLSNNDGCAIARSAEAKSLGIRMGQPWHELADMVRDHGLQARSANFALYGDMSARVVAMLRDHARRVEVYSIDESFLDLSGMREREAHCRYLSRSIHRWTGIPNCIGIGPTKTLAKLGNKLAKKGRVVLDVSDTSIRDQALEDFPVGDVWGVGPRWAIKLKSLGIETAAELRDASQQLILEKFGVVLHRTQRELQGKPCLGLEEVEPDRQQIMVSRSFGERVRDHQLVAQAIATFIVRACEKLRARGLTASAISVFAYSDPFRPELPQHHPSRSIALPAATSDTRLLLQTSSHLMRGMFRKGIGYKKAGVCLMDLARPSDVQSDLFGPSVVGNIDLMNTLDAINRKFGRGSAGFAASGWQTKPQWGMRQQRLSPCYTTRLSDLPIANC